MLADIRPRRQLRDDREECEKHIANIENAIGHSAHFTPAEGVRGVYVKKRQ